MKVVCGCCEPAESTPLEVYNRPALSAIAYRIGTYASFRQAMLEDIAEHGELAALTTRRSDDYGVTMLELWAAVADILTFHQERYVNEAFLRTAHFRDSVARLASLLDYRLRPGVAARTSIAFQLDPDKALTIPAGQMVQSVPEGDALPQTYETTEEIQADARLNRLRVFPAPIAQAPLAQERSVATLDRVNGPDQAAALAPGQRVVIFNNTPTGGIGVLQGGAGLIQGGFELEEATVAGKFAAASNEFDAAESGVKSGFEAVEIVQGSATAVLEEKEIKAIEVLDDRVELTWDRPIRLSKWTNTNTKAFRFNRTFRVFGHNAPASFMIPGEDPAHEGRIEWDLLSTDFGISAGPTLELDGLYENLSTGQELLVVSAAITKLVTITAIEQVNAELPTDSIPSKTAMAASVTRVSVSPNHPGGDRRKITVYVLEGAQLAFWNGSYGLSLSGNHLYLPGVAVHDDELGIGVEVGRSIERNEFKRGHVLFPVEIKKDRSILIEEDGQPTHEPLLATIKNAPTVQPPGVAAGDFCHLVVEINSERDLDHDADSAVVLGNVAAASHGESVRDEVVGSGNAAAAFLRLALGKKPLTYLPAATPAGSASSLELRVNRVWWQEVAGLFGQPADAPVYELRHTDDGTTIVQFGNREMGAPPPTGQGNIQVSYRVGSGLAGRVPALSLTTLLAKPTGLAEATNPLAAEGGADSESLSNARQNAPRTVRTFGRAVSLQDFEDLVTASGEVARAHATWVWDGLDRAIHLTIAGQDGGTFSATARRDLGRNLDASRDPNHRLRIDNFATVFIRLQAGVGVDANYDRDEVVAAAHAAVVDALSFERQRLARSLHLSDFYRLLQDVEGVVFVDIDYFHFKSPAGIPPFDYFRARGATFDPVQSHLRVFPARPHAPVGGITLPAELATLQSPTQDVTITLREA